MKKNVSINIQGVVFHIEESGYVKLREYLDSIHAYFSSFENSSEIISDIEDRIAELFTAKTKGQKTVVSQQDVLDVIEKMGSVNDFKDNIDTDGEDPPRSKASGTHKKAMPGKKLYRDKNRKIAGGVCAGIAHYFSIDPVWPRILFIILALSSIGVLLLVYVIFWIAMPASDTLSEQEDVAKMFRNAENKVIGGVASGLANFTGIDVVLIRILFVLSMFLAGSGMILYIVLWIILPEAKSMTDKMQMQGKPITLSNIEETIKKKVLTEDEQENTLTKVLLFPFRLIALIFEKLKNVLISLLALIIGIFRVGIGSIVVLVTLLLLGILLFVSGTGLGFIHLSSLWDWGISTDITLPIEALSNTFSLWMLIPIAMIPFITLIFILLLGLSILAKKTICKPFVWWTLSVILFVDIVAMGFVTVHAATPFTKTGIYREENQYAYPNTTPIFNIRDVGLDAYEFTHLNLIGHQDSVLRVVKKFEAQGLTKKRARKNTRMVTYQVRQENNVFTFDSNISFKEGSLFRAQRLEVDLYIPLDRVFKVAPDLWEIIQDHPSIQEGYCPNNTWTIDARGMECANYPEELVYNK